MRSENCELCTHLSAGMCEYKKRPIAKIRGCSLCPSGKKFFRARNSKEAIRLRVSNKNKGEVS